MSFKQFRVTFECRADHLGEILAALDPVPLAGLSTALIKTPKAAPESHSSGPKGADGLTPLRRAVMSVFDDLSTVSPSDMSRAAQRAGFKEGHLASTIAALVRSGRIKRTGQARYVKANVGSVA